MKKSIDETAKRFDEKSGDYDENRSERHMEAVSRVVNRTIQKSRESDVVVDLGAGTGLVTMEISPHVKKVIGLDISKGMLNRAREKAERLGIKNVEFARGSFRQPEQEISLKKVDLVVSNFAMHHLDDGEKKEAIKKVAELLGRNQSREKKWFILGDVIIFEDLDTPENHFNPEVDDPSTVDRLTSMFEAEGFVVDELIKLAPAAGVIVAYLTEVTD